MPPSHSQNQARLDATIAHFSLPADHPHAVKLKLPTPVREHSSHSSLTRRASFISKLRAKISRKDLRNVANYDQDAEEVGDGSWLSVSNARRHSSSVYSRQPSDKYLSDPPNRMTPSPSLTLDGPSSTPSPSINPRSRRQALAGLSGDDQLMTLAIQNHEKQKALFRSASKHALAANAFSSATPTPSPAAAVPSASVLESVAEVEPGADRQDSATDLTGEVRWKEGFEGGKAREKRAGKIFSESQAWSMWPSHTRAERCGSAGRQDAMSTRDFAVEVKADEEPVMAERHKGEAGGRRMRTGFAAAEAVNPSKAKDEAVKGGDESDQEPSTGPKLPTFLFPLKQRRSVKHKAESRSISQPTSPVKPNTAHTAKHQPNKLLAPPPALARITRYYTSLLTSSTTFRGANRRTSVSASTGSLAHPELEMLSVAPHGEGGGGLGLGEFLKTVDEGLDFGPNATFEQGGTIDGRLGGLSTARTWRGTSVFEMRRDERQSSGELWRGGGMASGDEEEPPGVGDVLEQEDKHGERDMLGIGPGQLDGEAPDEVVEEVGKAKRGAEYHAR